MYKYVWIGPGDGIPASCPGRFPNERAARAWIRETYHIKRLIGFFVWKAHDQGDVCA